MSAASDFLGLTAFLVAATISIAIMCWVAARTGDWDEGGQRQAPYISCKYAPLLGKVIEAKVYEGSDWERMVVVAVSWKGAVCVRPLTDLQARGRWIRKELVPERVREIE